MTNRCLRMDSQLQLKPNGNDKGTLNNSNTVEIELSIAWNISAVRKLKQ